MSAPLTLEHCLEDWAGGDALRADVAATVLAIAGAGRDLSGLIAQGPIAGAQGALVGVGAGGDDQKQLDIIANDLLVKALGRAPVAHIASEEIDGVLATGKRRARLAVAIDPLDGSSNIDTNVSVGTIFSILPVRDPGAGPRKDDFLQPGANQLAAGYVIYGPHTALVLSLGEGTCIFTLDVAEDRFVMTAPDVQIHPATREFAINASNYRHWDARIRLYVTDCFEGARGPRGEDFNMRWIASLVAECHRILMRGGIFLYPGDARDGYRRGRLRLVYEANPVAFLVEQAGGAASTGTERLLDLVAGDVHERVPLIFGSRQEVRLVERYHTDFAPADERSPLFGRRGLFRA